MDPGAIYTARLVGSVGPDPVLQTIVRKHEYRGGLPLAFVLHGGAFVQGQLAAPTLATAQFDERYEALVRRQIAEAKSGEERQEIEKHLASWEEHGRWSSRHRESAEREQKLLKAAAEAQGDGEWDPVRMPAEVVAPWLEAMGRPPARSTKR